jgi:hypothetical protein
MINYQLPIINYQLSITNYQLTNSYKASSGAERTGNPEPATSIQQQASKQIEVEVKAKLEVENSPQISQIFQ